MSQINLFKEYEDIFKDKEEAPEKKKAFEYGYSPFALQDAIGEKNVKKIWIEYQKLIIMGIEADDVIHKIIGKVRDMLAIKKGATKEDLNIKSDYPYNKSKRDSSNWKEKEIMDFYTDLISIYHKARMSGRSNGGSVGVEELGAALERTILCI